MTAHPQHPYMCLKHGLHRRRACRWCRETTPPPKATHAERLRKRRAVAQKQRERRLKEREERRQSRLRHVPTGADYPPGRVGGMTDDLRACLRVVLDEFGRGRHR